MSASQVGHALAGLEIEGQGSEGASVSRERLGCLSRLDHQGEKLLDVRHCCVIGPAFVLDENPQGIRAVSFALHNDRWVVTLEREVEVRAMEAGLGAWRYGEFRSTSMAGAAPSGGFQRSSNGPRPDTGNTAALSCGMHDEKTLELTARFVEDNLGAETSLADFVEGGTGVAITMGAGRPGAEPPVLRGWSD